MEDSKSIKTLTYLGKVFTMIIFQLCYLDLISVIYASEISFENQLLTKIPDVFVEIPGDTTVLKLSKNSIQNTSSQDFNGLNSLKVLRIDKNSLTRFPDLIHVSETLEELHLQYNGITQISDHELDILIHLQYLNMDSNQLTTFPDCQGPSQTLHTLLLSGNLMEEFPSFNRLGKSLIRLDLQYNKLQNIQLESTYGLDSLRYLILLGNQLTVFPDVTYMSDTLVVLDLFENAISEVPESHFLFAGEHKALVINLESNQLTSVPSPGCLPHNMHIRLQDNPLHCDDRLAWLLTTTGIRYIFYTYPYEDYEFNDTDPQYYNTLEHATCLTPAILTGKSLTELTYTDLGITGTDTPYFLLTRFL